MIAITMTVRDLMANRPGRIVWDGKRPSYDTVVTVDAHGEIWTQQDKDGYRTFVGRTR